MTSTRRLCSRRKSRRPRQAVTLRTRPSNPSRITRTNPQPTMAAISVVGNGAGAVVVGPDAATGGPSKPTADVVPGCTASDAHARTRFLSSVSVIALKPGATNRALVAKTWSAPMRYRVGTRSVGWLPVAGTSNVKVTWGRLSAFRPEAGRMTALTTTAPRSATAGTACGPVPGSTVTFVAPEGRGMLATPTPAAGSASTCV